MKLVKGLIVFFLLLVLLGIGGVIGLYQWVKPDLPNVDSLKTVQLQVPLRIYSSDGKLISQFGEQRRLPLRYDEVPQELIDAVLATEDARFFDHFGIDPIGIIRAGIVLATTGQKQQGASTITMQVARNFFLSREKTYIRKIKEIFIALEIERLLTKEEILELYLNRSFLGNRAYGVGAAAQVYYGKELNQLSLPQFAMIAGLPQAPSTANPIRNPERAKARRNVVLGRMLSVGMITQAQHDEAIQAPVIARLHGESIELYAPYLAEMARDHMVALYGEEAAYSNGFNVYLTIDSNTQQLAEKAVLDNIFAYDMRHGYRGPEATLWQVGSTQSKSNSVSAQAISPTPWSHAQIVSHLERITGPRGLEPAVVLEVQGKQATIVGVNGIPETLDWDGIKWARAFRSDTSQGPAPKQASDVLRAGMQIWVRQADEQKRLAQIPDVASAFVALDPNDGAILALIGGYDFGQSQYNRVTQAKRQLGSNIKPFLYSAALDNGFTLATLINNVPITQWDRSQGTAWRPKNSPDVYTGPTRVRQGLAQSINVMAVRMIRDVGIDTFIEHAERFGFNPDELPRNESLSLGSASATPLENARGFAVFKNGGFLINPYFIKRIEDHNDMVIEQALPQIACESCYRALARQARETKAPLLPQCLWPKSLLAPRTLSEANAFLINQTLESVIWGGGNWNAGTGWSGTAWRASRLMKRHDIGGKTGTTNDAGDTWFSGYGPGIVATSWMGFDNYSRKLGYTSWDANGPQNQISASESGAKSAGPAWNHFMAAYLKDVPVETISPPLGIARARIDNATGKLSTRNDASSMYEYFIEGTVPTEMVDLRRTTSADGTEIREEDELF